LHDVVVAGPDAPPLSSLDDLSGKDVYLLKNSVSWENLTALNQKLAANKKPRISLIAADANLERDDLVEMANAGMVQYTVTLSQTAQLWKNVFTNLKIYEDFYQMSGFPGGFNGSMQHQLQVYFAEFKGQIRLQASIQRKPRPD